MEGRQPALAHERDTSNNTGNAPVTHWVHVSLTSVRSITFKHIVEYSWNPCRLPSLNVHIEISSEIHSGNPSLEIFPAGPTPLWYLHSSGNPCRCTSSSLMLSINFLRRDSSLESRLEFIPRIHSKRQVAPRHFVCAGTSQPPPLARFHN